MTTQASENGFTLPGFQEYASQLESRIFAGFSLAMVSFRDASLTASTLCRSSLKVVPTTTRIPQKRSTTRRSGDSTLMDWSRHSMLNGPPIRV